MLPVDAVGLYLTNRERAPRPEQVISSCTPKGARWRTCRSGIDLCRASVAFSVEVSDGGATRLTLEQLAKELPPVDATKFVAAGELPALPTRAGRASIENERLADEEQKPLVKPGSPSQSAWMRIRRWRPTCSSG